MRFVSLVTHPQILVVFLLFFISLDQFLIIYHYLWNGCLIIVQHLALHILVRNIHLAMLLERQGLVLIVILVSHRLHGGLPPNAGEV